MSEVELIDIKVVCDDESHAPKVAKITTLATTRREDEPEAAPWSAYGTAATDDVVLVNERPHTRKEVFGGADGAGGSVVAGPSEIRHRHAMSCKLCGRRVEMTTETIQRVAQTLHSAGVSQVSLRGLAAIL